MKRPYLIYLIILLQCAIAVAIGAAILGIKAERDLQREYASLLSGELDAIRDQVAYARADIVSKLVAMSGRVDSAEEMESCQPSSGAWTVVEDRKIIDHNVCFIERFQRRLQQMTCSKDGQTTRQYNKAISDWTFVGSRSC